MPQFQIHSLIFTVFRFVRPQAKPALLLLGRLKLVDVEQDLKENRGHTYQPT